MYFNIDLARAKSEASVYILIIKAINVLANYNPYVLNFESSIYLLR